MDSFLKTKVGLLKIISDDTYVKEIKLINNEEKNSFSESKTVAPLIQQLKVELDEYFNGLRTTFDIPIKIEVGTDFQRAVWKVMLEIPYGQTMTYGAIAQQLGKPGAQRAVGGACNKNPLPLLIPCHRVVSSTGPGGFAWGMKAKDQLFFVEGVSI